MLTYYSTGNKSNGKLAPLTVSCYSVNIRLNVIMRKVSNKYLPNVTVKITLDNEKERKKILCLTNDAGTVS